MKQPHNDAKKQQQQQQRGNKQLVGPLIRACLFLIKRRLGGLEWMLRISYTDSPVQSI